MASKKKNKQIKPKTKKAICILSAILFFVFLFISLLLMINIFKLNMLPFKIVLPIMLVDITLIVLFAIFSLKQKIKWKIKVVCDIFMVILSICLFFANHYIDRTISFFKTVTDNNYEVENYYVLVLKDSKLKNKDDLLDKKVGFVDKLGTTNEALDKLKEEVTFENVNIKSIFELGNALLDKDVDAILMADYHKAILDEQTGEIGVFRTIGVSKFKLTAQFVLELLIVSIIMLGIGCISGAFLSKPIGNTLLQNEIEASKAANEEISNNFGKGGEKFEGPMEINKQGMARVEQIDSIEAVVDFNVIIQLLGIGILLTMISSLAAMISIQRFSPLTILKERS